MEVCEKDYVSNHLKTIVNEQDFDAYFKADIDKFLNDNIADSSRKKPELLKYFLDAVKEDVGVAHLDTFFKVLFKDMEDDKLEISRKMTGMLQEHRALYHMIKLVPGYLKCVHVPTTSSLETLKMDMLAELNNRDLNGEAILIPIQIKRGAERRGWDKFYFGNLNFDFLKYPYYRKTFENKGLSFNVSEDSVVSRGELKSKVLLLDSMNYTTGKELPEKLRSELMKYFRENQPITLQEGLDKTTLFRFVTSLIDQYKVKHA